MDLRPNRELHYSEKNYKLYLKQLLKDQHILYKYTMRYQQAIRRNDDIVATNTLHDLKQLTKRIQKMYCSSIKNEYDENNNDSNQQSDKKFSNIHYTHILNDPFITQIIKASDYGNDDPSMLYHDKNDIPVNETNIMNSATTTTTTTTTSNKSNKQSCTTQLSKERSFVEGFYKQLLQEISLSYNHTTQSDHPIQTEVANEVMTYSEVAKPVVDNNNNKVNNSIIPTNNVATIISSETHKDETTKTLKNTTTTTTKKISVVSHATTYDVTRELLRDMTKGTQRMDQFNNYYALLGYTRHKFIERAMLVASSLNQILLIQPPPRITIPSTSNSPTATNCPMSSSSHERIINDIILNQWKQRILSVRTMTSIGCGPGCDAVGVVAVLLSSSFHTTVTTTMTLQQQPSLSLQSLDNAADAAAGKMKVDDKSEQQFLLDRIVLLDWAMEQWFHPIVHNVSNMLTTTTTSYSSIISQQRQPQQYHRYVKSIICETCDVRKSVREQPIKRPSSTVHSFHTQQHMKDQNVERHENNDTDVNNNKEWLRNTDLVVISYLLSETRNSWYHFMDDYIRHYCKVGTLFLITDPTAWQLHIFRQRYEYDNSDPCSNCDVASSNFVSDDGLCRNGFDDDTTYTPSPTHEHQRHRRVLMEFQWLDSSMYRPELQELEGRNGPGVLLAMKVAN